MADKQKLSFPIVNDAGLATARSFGLVFALPDDLKAIYQSFGIDLPKFTGHAAWELPVPSRFVIDRAGIVRSVEADPDYTFRPEPEATLAVVRGLVG
jgi:peroxiredoxin